MIYDPEKYPDHHWLQYWRDGIFVPGFVPEEEREYALGYMWHSCGRPSYELKLTDAMHGPMEIIPPTKAPEGFILPWRMRKPEGISMIQDNDPNPWLDIVNDE